MLASVIVLSWNGMDYLQGCLDAVLAQDYPDLELIVVDNASSDGSPDFVEEQYPELRLIRNARNLGFAGGNNVGLRAATGDVLILLNQDTVVASGWLDALVSTLGNPAIGIVGCKALYPDGSIQHAGGFVYGRRAETDHTGRSEPDDGRFDQQRDVDFVTGAALAISRSTLTTVGLLDEGFHPAYYEDVDWCYTAREAGFRVVYAPKAQLVHCETPTANRGSHGHKYTLHRGRVRLVLKHWPAARLHQEFLPAERAWAASLGRTVEMMSARRAYLANMLDVATTAAFRARPEGVACDADPNQEALELLRVLEELRATCVRRGPDVEASEVDGEPAPAATALAAAAHVLARQTALIPRRTSAFAVLRDRQQIHERSFTSEVPVVGPLIAGLRQLWHAFAVRCGVVPLKQQSEFNARLGDLVDLLMEMDDQLRVALQHTQQSNAELERDVAENIREINALARRLAVMSRASSADRDETP
jgi:GT2 family glycosyltransferase